MSKIEWYAINHPGKLATGQEIASCPFLGAGGCEIYPRRPLICRLYGTVDAEEVESYGLIPVLPLYCQEGVMPERPLSIKVTLAIHAAYTKRVWGPDGEVRREMLAFQKWVKINPELEMPPKFQWLNYLLSTKDGRRILSIVTGQTQGAPPEAIQAMKEMMA